MMDYIKDLYNRLFGDFLHLNFDSEFDLNYTCNVFLTKNMTLIEIDRGWEGIPESLVIQLILCLFLILPFVIFRYLARYQPYDMENRKHKNWIQFIYGNRDIKKRTLIYLDKSFQSIEAYFKNKNILPNILPYHLIMCRNLKQRKLNQSSSNQSSKQPVSSHRRTHSTLYGSASSTKVDATPLKISSSAMNLQNNDHNQDNHNQLSTTSSTSTATSTAVVAAPSTSTSSNVPTITTSSYDDANKPNDAETNDEIFVLNSPSSSTSSAITTSTTDGSNVSVLNLVINDNNCSHNGENSQIKHQSQTTFPSDMNSPTVQTFLHPLRDVGDGKRSPSGDPMNYIQLLFTRLLNITDEDILKNKGHDAYQYLLFQRYIIIFLFILTIVTIVIILPINVQGNNEGKAFARTSISNVSHESSVYWAHAICSTFIIAVGVFLMNRFASELKTDDDLMYCKTLLIRHIPLIENLNEKILNYFREKFPEIEISGIQLIADLRQLDSLEQSYRNAMNAHEYCNDLNTESRNRHLQPIDDNSSSGNHHQDNVTIMVENGNDDYSDDNRFMIRPINCNRLCRCCCFQCCSAKIDAEEFYANEQQQLKEEIYQELISITNQSIRSAFITFRSESMAMRVYKYIKKEQKHSCQNCFLCNMCMNIIDYCYNDNARNEFDLTKCLVSHAPYPDDVNWRDIAFDMNLLWLRKMIISFILFIIFFFLSTPAFLLKIFDIIATKELIKNGILKPNSIITDFMSPFLLMLLAVILPSIVTYACQMTPYKTISDLNHAVMSKVFAFLVMMIIVLPSTGFLSINAMLGAIFASNGDQNRFRWHCLFPVDNGAFFVIYTLQATILGNVAEILRIPELVLYIVYSLFLRSKAEYKKARKWVTFDFPFGVSYARFLLIFTMTVIYSFACPLIAPCGLAYMFGKHLVDRYNIYHVYQPTKINRHIHSSAIMYVHIALVLMQFQLFTVMIVKTQYSHITLYVLIILILTLLESTFFGFHNWFRNLIKSPINRSKHTPKRDFCICSYTPPVLYHLLDDGIFQQQQQQQQQPKSAKTAD